MNGVQVPTSLVNLEPDEYLCIMNQKSGIARDRIHEPVVAFDTDGTEAWVDLAPGVPLPERPHEKPDEIDFESFYGIYYDDQGRHIPDYLEDMPELEPIHNRLGPLVDAILESRVSTDTEQSTYMGTLSLASLVMCCTPELSSLRVQISRQPVPSGDVRKVWKVMPTPPKFDQPLTTQMNLHNLVTRGMKTVVGQLTEIRQTDYDADSSIQEAFASARWAETTQMPVDTDDDIQAMFQAPKISNLKVTPAEEITKKARWSAGCSNPLVSGTGDDSEGMYGLHKPATTGVKSWPSQTTEAKRLSASEWKAP